MSYRKISNIGAPFLKALNNLGYSNICVKLNNNNFLYFFGHTVNKTESADVCYFYKLKLYTLSDNIFPLGIFSLWVRYTEDRKIGFDSISVKEYFKL